MSGQTFWVYTCIVLFRFQPWVLSKSWAHRSTFAEEPQQQKDKTNKEWNRKDMRYSCSVCADPLCWCESSVFWPYLGSFTINRWVRNSVYVVSGGGGGSWSRGKQREEAEKLHAYNNLFINSPSGFFSPPLVLSSSCFPSSHHCPTCSFSCTSLHLH